MGKQIKATISEDSIAQAGYAGKLLRDARECKVFRIRRQLKEGNYSLDERLDIAIERVIEDIYK